MPPKLIVTTSWDDGDIADVRLSETLLKSGLRGTFYVPLTFEGRPMVVGNALRSMVSHGFEIGGHGVTHRMLSSLTPDQVRSEVRNSKATLEQVVGRPVQMFCYPIGRYNAATIHEVRQAGYIGARTTRMLAFGIRDPFQMPVTVQAYPHPVRNYLKNLCRGRNLAGLGHYARVAPGNSNWVELSKRLFDVALIRGGIWHLYGHSWEIAGLNLWDQLQELLEYVGGRPGVCYATNGETIGTWRAEGKQEVGNEDRACA
jgi:peptidoglycan/xylan/chitin deacetylase (PgdA/CDA1 family)